MASQEPDYDDASTEKKWCEERRDEVSAYLAREGLQHGRIGEWPAWHLAPYVSLWAIESLRSPKRVGWWAICGDLPCDYVSAAEAKHPRDALREIARRWNEIAGYMEKGEEHPTISIGAPETRHELAPLLRSRAQLLAEWAEEERLWEDDAACDSGGNREVGG